MGKHPMRRQASAAGILWIKLAVLYLLVGVALGMAMGMRHDVTLRPVHAHVNLLGWTTMALAGLIYAVFPQAGASRLARLHFWLMNLALPVMLGGLAYILITGELTVLPALMAAEIAAAASIALFALNLFINLCPDDTPARDEFDIVAAARYA